MAEKRRLDVDSLKENGITYDETVNRAGKEYLVKNFPQASIVTEGLLDFKKILSQASFEKLGEKTQKKIDRYHKSYKIPIRNVRSSMDIDFYEEKYGVDAHDARFERARHISKNARNIRVAKEPRWSDVLKQGLFVDLIQYARLAEMRKVLDPRQLVERIRVEEEDMWIQGRKALKQTTPPNATPLKIAKPDLYIALPIIKRATNPRAVARGFHRDDCIQNFSEELLTKLEEVKNGNLISNPMTRLDRSKNIGEKDLVCYPSAVIEAKHHQVSQKEIEKCYCQAANGASTALSMLSRLSHFSVPRENFNEIPPVVAFTFIGHESRVWIAFISDKKWADDKIQCKYEMKCIWRGDLRETWDTVQLCRIIENLHYWIVGHFRPWVSNCLGRWKWVLDTGVYILPSVSNRFGRWKWDDEGKDKEGEDKEEKDKEGKGKEGQDEEDENEESDEHSIDGSSVEDSTLSGEEYELDTEDGSETESEDEGLSDGDDISDIEPENCSESVLNERRTLKNKGSSAEGLDGTASKSSHSTPRERRIPAAVASGGSSRKRAPLNYGETSPLPLRAKPREKHVRGRSTG